MDTTSGSYAAALAEVAKSTRTVEATSADMEKISKIFSDESVVDYLSNPTVPMQKKQSLLNEIAESSKFQPHTTNFLKIVVDMRRANMVTDMAEDFEELVNKLTGTEVAVVTSVVELDPRHLGQIAKSVQKLTKAKNVRIKTAIDPKLVGGFTIRFGNDGSKFIDMSIKKQLEEIAGQLEFDVQLLPAN